VASDRAALLAELRRLAAEADALVDEHPAAGLAVALDAFALVRRIREAERREAREP
jgi:hypothetical protein